MTDSFDFSVFPTLVGERSVLRELGPADALDLFAFRSDPEVQRYNSAPMHDPAEAAALIRQLEVEYAAHRGLYWGITLREDAPVVGLIGLARRTPTTHEPRSATTFDATTGVGESPPMPSRQS